MPIAATQAALRMEEHADQPTPHELITLMMDGALERIEQARQILAGGDTEQAGLLMGKVVGIVNGLRESLDLNDGGEIAANMDSLYEYINARLCEAEEDNGREVLNEAERLLNEIKSGWEGIAA